jgi:CRP/FNR family transcriptional regulator
MSAIDHSWGTMLDRASPGSNVVRLQRPNFVSSAEATGEFTELSRMETLVAVRGGRTLFHEGDPARRFFRVISGTIRTCRLLADGRRQIGDFFLPGDFFGFGATDTYLHSAEAIVGTTLSAYPLWRSDGMLQNQPRLTSELLRIMLRRLADAQDRMAVLGRKTARERIATFLLAMEERCREGDHIHLPMPRADIADHLGLSRETVSRVMTGLCARELITLNAANDIRLLDRAALAALADGD